jgi:acetyltransferase-like isoleucine patch superfamily enzyme
MNDDLRNKLLAIGENTFIAPTVIIRRPHLVKIGKHCAIDHGVYITTQADIGDYVHISPYVTCIGGEKSKLVVGHFAGISAGARIIAGGDMLKGDGLLNVTAPEKYKDKVNYSTINIERFSFIGTNAVIMPGITIAEGSVVGACSLVTKNTEPWTIYFGIPAKPIKLRNKEKMLQYAKELGYL